MKYEVIGTYVNLEIGTIESFFGTNLILRFYSNSFISMSTGLYKKYEKKLIELYNPVAGEDFVTISNDEIKVKAAKLVNDFNEEFALALIKQEASFVDSRNSSVYRHLLSHPIKQNTPLQFTNDSITILSPHLYGQGEMPQIYH